MVIPMPKRKPGRPRGSKSKSHDGYALRTQKIKQKYGDNIFQRWGLRKGNVIDLD